MVQKCFLKKQAHLFFKIWEIWGRAGDSCCAATKAWVWFHVSQKRGFLCDAPYKQHGVDPRELPKWGSWSPCCSERNIYSGTWLILLLASERLLEGIFIWQKKQVPVASCGMHWRVPSKQESSQCECVSLFFQAYDKMRMKKVDNISHSPSSVHPGMFLCLVEKYSARWIINPPLLCSQEKAMAPHSSTLAWKIPWTEEPGGPQSMGSLRVGHDWATSLSLFTPTLQVDSLPAEPPGKRTGAGLSGNFGSNTGWAFWLIQKGLDHLENCLFSETENGCYNQKSFMQHALLALQIQFFFFNRDVASCHSLWPRSLSVQIKFSFASTTCMIQDWQEAWWIQVKKKWFEPNFFLPLPYPE